MEIRIISEYDGMMIKDFARMELHFSRRLLKTLKENDVSVLVNGKKRQLWEKLTTGDVLKILFPEEAKASYLIAENMDLPIVYEDDSVLVIDKPAGIAVIPSMNQPTGTIANGILGYYQRKNIPFTVHIVTRLDRNTSGLMLIAKHRYSHSLLSEMQKANQVNRRYLALVTGILKQEKGTISANIGRKPGSIIERIVSDSGQRAVTHYQVLETNHFFSLVKVQLETGRTHQIRVHFSALGHPLIGDDLYGGDTDLLHRQALHSAILNFVHPITNQQMQFTSQLPDDIQRCLESTENK